MKESEIHGIVVALVTPFDASECVDEDAFRVLIDYCIEGGVHGIFPIGSSGEFHALTIQEKKRLIEIAVEHADGRAFVIPCTSGITTRECVELTTFAEAVGADGASIITPFYINPSQEELYNHYVTIASSVSFPVLAYNNPSRTGVNLLPQTVARIAEQCPNFLGIKDSSGDLTQTLEYLRLCPPDFRTLVGRDSLIYPALLCGAAGAVAATANIVPKLVVSIYQSVQGGDFRAAREAQERLTPLRLAFSLGTFPAMIKEALSLMGLPGGRCRGPIAALSSDDRQKLKQILRDLHVL